MRRFISLLRAQCSQHCAASSQSTSSVRTVVRRLALLLVRKSSLYKLSFWSNYQWLVILWAFNFGLKEITNSVDTVTSLPVTKCLMMSWTRGQLVRCLWLKTLSPLRQTLHPFQSPPISGGNYSGGDVLLCGVRNAYWSRILWIVSVPRRCRIVGDVLSAHTHSARWRRL